MDGMGHETWDVVYLISLITLLFKRYSIYSFEALCRCLCISRFHSLCICFCLRVSHKCRNRETVTLSTDPQRHQPWSYSTVTFRTTWFLSRTVARRSLICPTIALYAQLPNTKLASKFKTLQARFPNPLASGSWRLDYQSSPNFWD